MTKASQLALNSSRNIQRSLTMISTAATAMAAGVIASLGAVMAKAEDYAFTIQKMASITGVSSEMFSKLAYSAKLVGVPIDTVKGALERLARTSGAAKSGNKDAIAAYAALGISLKDLNGPLKDAGDLSVSVAKKLDVYRDSTNKTNLEQKIFGRSGAELAPLLKQLATGFDTASQQATLFGVVIGDKSAAQAKQLHESLQELESVALGFSLRLLSGVSPALEDVSSKILTFATSAGGMKVVDRIAADVSTAVRGVGSAFEFLTEHSRLVTTALGSLAAIKTASIFLPMISGAASAGKGIADVGLAALTLVGRFTGIGGLGKLFIPVITGAWGTVTALISLAGSEGIAATASYAFSEAIGAVRTALLANPITALAVILGTVATGFYKVSDAALATEVDGGKWTDIWHAGLLGLKEDLNDVIKTLDLLKGDWADFYSRQYKFTPFQGLVQQAGQARRGMSDDQYRMLHAKDIQKDAVAEAPKLDAPIIPKAQADKIDHLKLKMDELAAAAKAAQQTLRDAGKNVDFERSDEIAKEYTKTIIELEAALKAQHKTLSDANKAAIYADIATKVNSLSQAKYRDELEKSTESLLGQASAQEILNQAIGKGVAAVRAASVAAEAAKRDQGKSPEWVAANGDLRAKNDAAAQRQRDAQNASADKTSLINIQDQINAQLKLNGAILQGSDAREAANKANEEASIRKNFTDRGDNQTALNAEIAANRQLYEIKKQQSDLDRAASMNPALVYDDQVRALNGAAEAARNAGQAISDMQLKASDKAAWNSYLEAIDKTNLAVGDMSDGVGTFFREMGRDTTSAAQQVHDVLGGAFNSLNQTLEKLVSGQKTSFAEFFRSISSQLTKIGLQKAEQGIAKSITDKMGNGDPQHPQKGVGGLLGSLLGGKKTDPTTTAVDKSNAYLAQILDQLRTGTGGNGMPGLPGMPKGFGSGLPGYNTSTSDGATGGFTAAADKAGGSMFGEMDMYGGGRAVGGDVTAGVTYDVGEMGREKFTPTQDGKITPNKDLGHSGPLIGHIDARGSNDPAQTQAAIHRAMQSYAPAIAQSTIRAVFENKQRSPLSSSH